MDRLREDACFLLSHIIPTIDLSAEQVQELTQGEAVGRLPIPTIHLSAEQVQELTQGEAVGRLAHGQAAGRQPPPNSQLGRVCLHAALRWAAMHSTLLALDIPSVPLCL